MAGKTSERGTDGACLSRTSASPPRTEAPAQDRKRRRLAMSGQTDFQGCVAPWPFPSAESVAPSAGVLATAAARPRRRA